MVAAGWDDESWAVAPCYCDSYSGGSCAGLAEVCDGWTACLPGDLATGDTGGMGPALHIVYQVTRVNWEINRRLGIVLGLEKLELYGAENGLEVVVLACCWRLFWCVGLSGE